MKSQNTRVPSLLKVRPQAGLACGLLSATASSASGFLRLADTALLPHLLRLRPPALTN